MTTFSPSRKRHRKETNNPFMVQCTIWKGFSGSWYGSVCQAVVPLVAEASSFPTTTTIVSRQHFAPHSPTHLKKVIKCWHRRSECYSFFPGNLWILFCRIF